LQTKIDKEEKIINAAPTRRKGKGGCAPEEKTRPTGLCVVKKNRDPKEAVRTPIESRGAETNKGRINGKRGLCALKNQEKKEPEGKSKADPQGKKKRRRKEKDRGDPCMHLSKGIKKGKTLQKKCAPSRDEKVSERKVKEWARKVWGFFAG